MVSRSGTAICPVVLSKARASWICTTNFASGLGATVALMRKRSSSERRQRHRREHERREPGKAPAREGRLRQLVQPDRREHDHRQLDRWEAVPVEGDVRHARQHPHRVAQQPRFAVDSRDGEHDPGKQHQAQPAAALREEAEQGEQKQGRREKPAHVVPDAGESELRIAEGEDRPVDIREHELGQRLGRKVPTSCPSSGMFAERRLDDVVERGNQERRAQQRPGDRTARDLAGKRPHPLAAKAAATPREPADP